MNWIGFLHGLGIGMLNFSLVIGLIGLLCNNISWRRAFILGGFIIVGAALLGGTSQ